jgi:hypothetical protein
MLKSLIGEIKNCGESNIDSLLLNRKSANYSGANIFNFAIAIALLYIIYLKKLR